MIELSLAGEPRLICDVCRRPEPAAHGRPVFEIDPSARLVACLRQAFPGFSPTDRWWIQLEIELKTVAWRTGPQNHDQFVARYPHLRGDDVIEFLQANWLLPAPPVDEYHRLANNLSQAARMTLAALDEWTAYKAADQITRSTIEDRTRLSLAVIRRVMERELPYLQPQLVQSKTGPAGGYWLTPEGRLVAATIAKTILPSAETSPPRPSIRRTRHA
jgi:hypothetical protein